MWRFWFNKSAICWICKRSFKKGDAKVKDNDHINGKYLNAVHQYWKLNFIQTKELYVVLHDLQDYNSRLIFQEGGK